jgi:hypothetical protein
MSIPSEEFARYSKAERQLCDEAAPRLAAIIQGIEFRLGICITEIRVTVDRTYNAGGSAKVNCTIVGAHDFAPSDRSATVTDGNSTRNEGNASDRLGETESPSA